MRARWDFLLTIILLAMILTVTIFSPDQLTQKFLRLSGWKLIEEKVETGRRVEGYRGTKLQARLLESVNEEGVEETLKKFTSLKSRVPGYPGSEEAFQYVKQQFEEVGLKDLTVESFDVVVPVDKGARLTVSSTGEEIPLFCLWPNQVKTPSLPKDGVVGNLIYGGKGEFSDLNGKKVQGSIVLMDFDSGTNYVNVRMLGALAIIFFDRGSVTLEEAKDKFLSVPVDIPRFWVDGENAGKISGMAESGKMDVTLKAKMDWEKVEAKNIYGYLPGKDSSGRLIVLESYYDSMSIVPALAPGAENACGITALLGIAKILKNIDRKHSVLFLATSAHFEGLSGVNDFLYRHSRKSDFFRSRLPNKDKIDFDLFIGLDLSSHNDKVASFTMGTFYNPSMATDNYQKNMMSYYSKKFSDYSEKEFPGQDRHIDAITPSKRTWKDFMPVGIGLDNEAVTFVGLGGISFVTPNDMREMVDTPSDKMDYVDVRSLTEQIRTVSDIMMKAVNDPGLFPDTSLELKDQGHSLEGYIYWFNRDVNFAVPKDPIGGAIVTYQQPGFNSVCGVRTLMVTIADEKGKKKGHFKFDIIRNAWSNKVLAYKLGDYGEITWAPDMGQEGNATYPITQGYVWWEDRMIEVLFRCKALSIFEMVDSQYLSMLDYLTILGPDDSVPQWYGSDFVPGQSRKEGKVTRAAVVYAKPGTRVKILMSTGLLGVKYLLTDAPEEFIKTPLSEDKITDNMILEAGGKGYPIDMGVIYTPLYKATKDMWIIDDVRTKQMLKYGVKNDMFLAFHEDARGSLNEAERYLREYRYEEFMSTVRRAAGFENRGYPDVKETANDTVRGIIFYFILLIPFSFFCERLIFGFTDIRKRIAGFAGFFVLIFIILRFVHPAFKLSSSPYIIFLAFIILAMGSIVVFIITSKFKQEMQKVKRTSSGIYEADIGRISATAAAISLGISNLRKRKLRTGLTITTLTLVSFTALSFTSIRTSLRFYRIMRSNKPPYQGAMIRDRSWVGLQPIALDYVRSAFEKMALIVPRAWYLGQKGERVYIDFESVSSDKSSSANGLVGMTSDEPSVTGIDRILLKGSRWFLKGERKVCILPSDMAKLVGITPEDAGKAKIRMLGTEFTVVGIVDSEKFNRMSDMDNEKLTPVDTVTEATKISKEAAQDPRAAATAPFQTFIHLESSNSMILPYEDVIEIGGKIQSITITDFRDEQGRRIPQFKDIVERFVSRIALPIFVGQGDRVTVYTSAGATSFSGLKNLIIPIFIAILIVLNTMMGSVYERFKEIGIYSSVGLAPIHIAALFMAESAVFATIGAVLGYLIGQVTVLILYSNNMLGAISMNYSSLSAITSTLIVIAAVFLSTIYPAKKASDMAVPDVTRRWKFPEPEGDEWKFDFPFTVGGAEALGMYSYIYQVFESYGESSIGGFLTEGVEFENFAPLDGSEVEAGKTHYRISMNVWLAPYDLGISQRVVLNAIPTGEHNIYRIAMEITRLSGQVSSWRRINRGFLHILRKRFLVWRTIHPEIKARYAETGREILLANTVLSGKEARTG